MKSVFVVRLAREIVSASPSKRWTLICTLGIWFALGAYVSSGILQVADLLVPADLGGTYPALAGGLLTSLAAASKSV
jgi:hypothetical protein